MSAHVLLVVENVSLAHDHRLRKQAMSLRAAGYDVTVICRRDPENRRSEGIRVLDYPAPPDAGNRLGFLWEYAYSWAMAAALTWRLYLSHPFDVIQISGMPDIYFAIAAPFRLLGVHFVLDQRDLSPEVYVARYGTSKGLVHRALLTCERVSFRSADHVVTVNESLRAVACERGGLDAEGVTVVGNGPHSSRATKGLSPSQRRSTSNSAGSVCCWVGLMGPQDSLDIALRAVAHLVHERGRNDTKVILIGDGEARPKAEMLVDQLGIRQHVEFTGWLGEDVVFQHLRASDVGLEPNMEPVVSPVKVMEYMASGLPFVAFDLLETRALGEGSGEYVPQGDVIAFAVAIDALLADPRRRDRMGAVGRQLVTQRIAWEHQEVAYLRVFRRLLAQHERGVRRVLRLKNRAAADQSERRSANVPFNSATSLTSAPSLIARGSGVALPYRFRHRARIYLSESPTFYLPLARRRYPGPSPQVVGPATELVIDGYTRCASTFVVYAFQLAQERPVLLAHHLHATGQLIEAVRRGLPALAVIREPRGAILSQLVREPKVDLRDALIAYSRFYEQLMIHRQGMVVGDFEQLTRDLGSVVRRLNTRFGTSWAQPQLDDEMLAECRELVTARSTLSPVQLMFESGLVSRAELRASRTVTGRDATYGGAAPVAELNLWGPSAERDRAKLALSASWDLASPRLRQRAQDAYAAFIAPNGQPDDRALHG